MKGVRSRRRAPCGCFAEQERLMDCLISQREFAERCEFAVPVCMLVFRKTVLPPPDEVVR